MTDFDELYRELGRKIRQARERQGERLSQDALAKQLGISRASIVNIEAGRQRTPLHLLWQIAELLGTELTLLKALTGLVRKLQVAIDAPRPDGKSHEQRKSRN